MDEKVLDALQQIPTVIDGAQRVLKIYPDSERLRALSDTFYASILAALGHMIHYLRKKASSKLREAVKRPFTSNDVLVDKIKAVEAGRDAFNREADICHREMVQRMKVLTSQEGDETREEVKIIGEAIDEAAQEHSRALQMIQRKQSELGRDVKMIKEGVPIALKQIMDLLKGGDGIYAHSTSMSRYFL